MCDTLHVTFAPERVHRGQQFVIARRLAGFQRIGFYESFVFVVFETPTLAASAAVVLAGMNGISSVDYAKQTYTVPYPQPDDSDIVTSRKILHITHLPPNYSKMEILAVCQDLMGFQNIQFYGKYCYAAYSTNECAAMARFVLREQTNLVVTYAKPKPDVPTVDQEATYGLIPQSVTYYNQYVSSGQSGYGCSTRGDTGPKSTIADSATAYQGYSRNASSIDHFTQHARIPTIDIGSKHHAVPVIPPTPILSTAFSPIFIPNAPHQFISVDTSKHPSVNDYPGALKNSNCFVSADISDLPPHCQTSAAATVTSFINPKLSAASFSFAKKPPRNCAPQDHSNKTLSPLSSKQYLDLQIVPDEVDYYCCVESEPPTNIPSRTVVAVLGLTGGHSASESSDIESSLISQSFYTRIIGNKCNDSDDQALNFLPGEETIKKHAKGVLNSKLFPRY